LSTYECLFKGGLKMFCLNLNWTRKRFKSFLKTSAKKTLRIVTSVCLSVCLPIHTSFLTKQLTSHKTHLWGIIYFEILVATTQFWGQHTADMKTHVFGRCWFSYLRQDCSQSGKRWGGRNSFYDETVYVWSMNEAEERFKHRVWAWLIVDYETSTFKGFRS